MPKRRPLPAMPPPLRGIAIDGSNVIASATAGAARRLELALAWCAQQWPSAPIDLFVDAATLGRCPRAVRVRIANLDRDGAGACRLHVGARGVPVDAALLERAAATPALVLSNDRFRGHEERRRGVVTLQFELQGDTFAPHAEATWFTPAGGATRVAVAALVCGR